MKDQIYIKRLRRCSTEQLVGLRNHLAAHGNMRNAKWMLSLVMTVLLARVGLSAS